MTWPEAAMWNEWPDLDAAHNRSFRNRPNIEASVCCGCFYCIGVCRPTDVKEYVRRDETALCPRCGIDSLIGDASGFPVANTTFLRAMRAHWFEQ